MFDEHAQQLLTQLPKLPGLDPAQCRRMLTAAYALVVERRLNPASGAEELKTIRPGLRRMVDALESVAIFEPLNGVEVAASVVAASAFTAAEALAILAQMPVPAAEPGDMPRERSEPDAIQHPNHYAAVESALLYLIAGYDVNAVAVVRALPPEELRQDNSLAAATRTNASYLLARLRAFCTGDVRPPATGVPFTGYDDAPTAHDEILMEARLRAYEILASAVNEFLDWLAGRPGRGHEAARALVERVRRASVPPALPLFTDLADLHHLASLMLAAFDATERRSVVHTVPPPDSASVSQQASFQAYLRSRALEGRPFLWPSAQEFVRQCLPGPKSDVVVAMPTGSGKSFVAELGIADAITRGSVIYLAPTNALVHQIRRDLRHALKAFADVDLLAFVGSGEYSGQFEDLVVPSTRRFVAVMTPEKCALALRLSREAFSGLALCVFDECHLLNDDSRGITADILMAQLFVAAPTMNFVLMSAMISNPDELANWLAHARGGAAAPSVTKWRPSRTLRGLLGTHHGTFQPRAMSALATLRQAQKKNPKRKNQKFDADLAVAASLSGPWTLDGVLDYRVIHVPATVPAYVTTAGPKPAWGFDSWKNQAALAFARSLATAGMPIIAFILSSRHHVFSLAAQVDAPLPDAPGAGVLPPLVDALLKIADAELGVPSAVRDLLRRGVAVHTSALLQVEQAASEWMFKHEKAKLMLATPTLAQGLNLPAIGVVIAGTSLGGSGAPGADNLPGLRGRTDATILNSFGRAGRPGFSNQGVAVLVPDSPSQIHASFDAKPAIAKNPVLQRPDAAVAVHSPIEHYLDRALLTPNQDLAVSDVEWELTTLLAESPVEDDAANILRRTFAGYRKRAAFTSTVAASLRDRIGKIRQDFLEQAEIPQWLSVAAAQAGVGVFRAQRLWQAYSRRGIATRDEAATYSLTKWFAVLVETMREMPPWRIAAYMADDAPFKSTAKKQDEGGPGTVLVRLRDAAAPLGDVDTVPWNKPEGWDDLWTDLWRIVIAHMTGRSLAEQAAELRGEPLASIGSDRGTGKALPAVFAFQRDVIEALARDAGCFVALNEHALRDADADYELPENLQALPLCIRYGCDSLGVLGWFRFGYRHRVCAHALSVAFPVPSTVSNDEERARWIGRTRYHWMEGKISAPPDASPILSAVATILRNEME